MADGKVTVSPDVLYFPPQFGNSLIQNIFTVRWDRSAAAAASSDAAVLYVVFKLKSTTPSRYMVDPRYFGMDVSSGHASGFAEVKITYKGTESAVQDPSWGPLEKDRFQLDYRVVRASSGSVIVDQVKTAIAAAAANSGGGGSDTASVRTSSHAHGASTIFSNVFEQLNALPSAAPREKLFLKCDFKTESPPAGTRWREHQSGLASQAPSMAPVSVARESMVQPSPAASRAGSTAAAPLAATSSSAIAPLSPVKSSSTNPPASSPSPTDGGAAASSSSSSPTLAAGNEADKTSQQAPQSSKAQNGASSAQGGSSSTTTTEIAAKIQKLEGEVAAVQAQCEAAKKQNAVLLQEINELEAQRKRKALQQQPSASSPTRGGTAVASAPSDEIRVPFWLVVVSIIVTFFAAYFTKPSVMSVGDSASSGVAAASGARGGESSAPVVGASEIKTEASKKAHDVTNAAAAGGADKNARKEDL